MFEATEEWRLAALRYAAEAARRGKDLDRAITMLAATTKVAEAEMVDLAEFDGTVAAAHSMVRRMRRAS